MQSSSAQRDPQRVREIFDRIAARYDLANHLLSCGADFFWRARAARTVAKWQPARVLDLASGSGDLALALQRKLAQAEIIAADFSEPMLERARRKGVRHTQVADALALPFDTSLFAAITVAFGFRNMADWPRALREMHRVLTPGGHLLILDFSLPSNWLKAPYRFYLHRILPTIAALITREKSAYEYLGESIETFPSGAAMLQLLEQNGFSDGRFEPLTFGVAAIYTARKT